MTEETPPFPAWPGIIAAFRCLTTLHGHISVETALIAVADGLADWIVEEYETPRGKRKERALPAIRLHNNSNCMGWRFTARPHGDMPGSPVESSVQMQRGGPTVRATYVGGGLVSPR